MNYFNIYTYACVHTEFPELTIIVEKTEIPSDSLSFSTNF